MDAGRGYCLALPGTPEQGGLRREALMGGIWLIFAFMYTSIHVAMHKCMHTCICACMQTYVHADRTVGIPTCMYGYGDVRIGVRTLCLCVYA